MMLPYVSICNSIIRSGNYSTSLRKFQRFTSEKKIQQVNVRNQSPWQLEGAML